MIIPDIMAASLGLAVFALLTAAALSPLETLSWWAGWTEQEIDHDEAPLRHSDERQRLYIVYLSGVASISGKYLIRREKKFVQRLRASLPDAVLIENVFPYSPAGLPLLASPRLFDRLWRRIQKLQLQGRQDLLRGLINIRNIYQVLVSADHRYGPIFSQGAAQAIERALLASGYSRSCGAPVVIIGYSGGAQVAVGAAPFLKDRLGAVIDVISVGGVVSSDPGLVAVRRLHHIYGSHDRVEKIGAVMFAERWRAVVNSHWNTAKREGRIVLKRMENIFHAGPRGYFGLPKINGVSNNDRTLEVVIGTIGEIASTPPEHGRAATP